MLKTSSSIANSIGDIMSVGLFFQLLVCAISLAIYSVGLESNDILSMRFFISAIGLTNTISSTYAYCYLSEYVTYNLAMVGDYFYSCAWYCLPIKQQQLFILPIQRAQLKFRINGLGIVECSLRVFSSVTFEFLSYEINQIFENAFFSVIFLCVTDHACSLFIFSHHAWFQVNKFKPFYMENRGSKLVNICK